MWNLVQKSYFLQSYQKNLKIVWVPYPLFGLKPNNQVFFLIEAKTEKIFFQSMGKKGPVSHAPVSESRSPFGSADLNANYKEVEDCFLCRPEQ